MAIQYIIAYDYLDNKGFVHVDQKTPPIGDRDEANKLWVEMKRNPCFQNMRPEKKDTGVMRHVVNVTFSNKKVYTYETAVAIKKGSWVVVETERPDPYSGETIKEKKVVQTISDDYNESEESIGKRFPIKQLKPIFGVVKLNK